MPSIVSENLNLKIGNSMQIGGPPQKWHLKSPLQKGERATLILRWRRFEDEERGMGGRATATY